MSRYVYSKWAYVEIDTRDRVVGRYRHAPSTEAIASAYNRGHRVYASDAPAVVLLGTALAALPGVWQAMPRVSRSHRR